ncbi:hypothetical protein ANCCAN_29610 [Ancylostoma caninum]|uniref:Uncharacterized protein n=1 Tax=Ancylostoma caninum TaxID=29170 RepID=A0A368F0Y3_ANCCA|nr:hypothetical protein ANCCAN_29610 [Ancylostoma caninum]
MLSFRILKSRFLENFASATISTVHVTIAKFVLNMGSAIVGSVFVHQDGLVELANAPSVRTPACPRMVRSVMVRENVSVDVVAASMAQTATDIPAPNARSVR